MRDRKRSERGKEREISETGKDRGDRYREIRERET